jgi:hypothetical protein
MQRQMTNVQEKVPVPVPVPVNGQPNIQQPDQTQQSNPLTQQ